MQFSHKWLQRFFDEKIPSAEEISQKLGIHSFELEGLEKVKNNDSLIDLDILPNRSSDSYSYKGIAQEVSALFSIPLREGIFTSVDGKKDIDSKNYINLIVDDSEKIKRATKRIAKNVKIEESPDWLKELLESIGQKSINNVVDITNYVMWMTGQPVHAFDYDKLTGGDSTKDIRIRKANDGEKIIDLTGEEHELDHTMYVISDSEKALDIAGIKGGLESGVGKNTTTVMLSVVNFDFQNIRNTSRKLKLRTDASMRFENEVPLCRIDDAMNLFSRLMEEIAGADISFNIIDTNPFNFENKEIIEISKKKINSVLGAKLDEEKIKNIFESLNLKTSLEKNNFSVEIPCDRLDLNIPEDLIEEIGRIIGYDNLPAEMPSEGFDFPEESKFKTSYYKTLDLLVSLGFYEIQSRALSKTGVIELENPYTSELSFVRDNLMDKLREKSQKEIFNLDEPKLFEIGKIFTDYETDDKTKIVSEHWSFAGIIGKRKIKEKQKEDLFYRTKGYLEQVFNEISVKNIDWVESEAEDIVADIIVAGKKIGFVGVNFWEINFDELIKNIDLEVCYKQISKFPKIEKDISFWVTEEFTVKEARELINSVLGENLKSLELFDVYKDKENNRKSFAFKIIFQSYKETLSDEFANGEMDKVYTLLKEKGFETR